MTYFPPDIIDNATTIFAEALEQTILKADQRQLDIATGYFAPEVWRIVGNALAELRAFRLLLGERPDVPLGGPEIIDLRRYYRAKIADDLAQLTFDRQHAELVDALLAFLPAGYASGSRASGHRARTTILISSTPCAPPNLAPSPTPHLRSL